MSQMGLQNVTNLDYPKNCGFPISVVSRFNLPMQIEVDAIYVWSFWNLKFFALKMDRWTPFQVHQQKPLIPFNYNYFLGLFPWRIVGAWPPKGPLADRLPMGSLPLVTISVYSWR